MTGHIDVVFGVYEDWGDRFKLWNKGKTQWMSHFKERIKKNEEHHGHAGVTKLTLDSTGDYEKDLKFGP